MRLLLFSRRCGWPKFLRSLLQVWSQILILVGGDEIDTCCDCGFPSRNYGVPRTEVIVLSPALILCRSEAVEGIETYPVTQLMRMIHQCAEALIVRWGPFAPVSLPTLFHG